MALVIDPGFDSIEKGELHDGFVDFSLYFS